MSRPSEDDRPLFVNPRPASPVEPKLKDIAPDEMPLWESMSHKRTPEELAETERVVEEAIAEARSQSGRLIKGSEKEQLPSLEDFARAAQAQQSSPSGRVSRQQWGSGMGLKKD